MDQLDNILAEATRAMPPIYFNLPIAHGEPVLRERVYCYELYHQMRLRWPSNIGLVLSGEVDKQGHEILRNLGLRAAAPDFLVHTPGDMGGNHAIIEVKSKLATPRGVEKDLSTLSDFVKTARYNRAIYLFYGGMRLENVQRTYAKLEDPAPIELWLHAEQGHPAELTAILGSR